MERLCPCHRKSHYQSTWFGWHVHSAFPPSLRVVILTRPFLLLERGIPHIWCKRTPWHRELPGNVNKPTLLAEKFAIQGTFPLASAFNISNPILCSSYNLQQNVTMDTTLSGMTTDSNLLSFQKTKPLRGQQQSYFKHTHLRILLWHTQSSEYVEVLLCFPHSSSWTWMWAQRDGLAMSSLSAFSIIFQHTPQWSI